MKVLTDINRGSIGASEISTLFTRDGIRSKGVATLAIKKAKEIVDNYSDNINSIPMMHGLFNEQEAFKLVVKELFIDAILQPDLSIKIQDGMHASPDVICPISEVVIDIKCPYNPITYFQNISSPKKGYEMQVQCQMLATRYKVGYLLYYLTSNKSDEWGNKIEYNIPLEDRWHLHKVNEDEDLQAEMVERCDDFLRLRDKVILDIRDSVELDDNDYFRLCRSKKVTALKDKSNILAWQNSIIKYDNEYYVYEQKNG